jgi:hypothetical protein
MKKKNKKILLIQPTPYDQYGNLVKKSRLYFVGLAMPLLAALTPKGWEVEICYETIEDVPFDTDADLIGISSMGHAVMRTIDIANKFRELGKTVVLGGYMVSLMPEEAKKYADAVMIGKGFAECEEACGEIYWATSVESFMHGRYFSNEERQRWINNYDSYGEFYINDNDDNPMTLKPFREYYGMSTRRAQLQTGGCGTKTSEGISRPVEVKYPVKKWLNNVESYLRSAMTYTNSHTISDLNTAECIILGGNTYQTYMK